MISQNSVGSETSAQDVVDGSSWLVGGWLGLPRRRTARSSGGDVVAVRPVRPQGGFAAVAISDGSARETIGDGVIFAVYMADVPRIPALGEALPQVVTFLEEKAEVRAMATPLAVDALDNEHGIQLEDQGRAPRAADSAPEACAEAVEFGDVVGGRARAEICGESGRGSCRRSPRRPPRRAPSADHGPAGVGGVRGKAPIGPVQAHEYGD